MQNLCYSFGYSENYSTLIQKVIKYVTFSRKNVSDVICMTGRMVLGVGNYICYICDFPMTNYHNKLISVGKICVSEWNAGLTNLTLGICHWKAVLSYSDTRPVLLTVVVGTFKGDYCINFKCICQAKCSFGFTYNILGCIAIWLFLIYYIIHFWHMKTHASFAAPLTLVSK